MTLPPLFDVYDELLVPLIFQAYADDVADRLGDVKTGSVLEIAAGTGAVTRSMARTLLDDVSITATDLMQPMLDRAIGVGTARPVEWREADVMSLPFDRDSFDVVVCQFGAMFFNPKPAAFAEVLRVLRPGGRFLVSVWDELAANEFAVEVTAAMKATFPDDPPGFLERVPYSYHDRDTIVADLRAGGFAVSPSVERIEHVSRADTSQQVATAFCAGTPLRDEIAARDSDGLATAIETVGAALTARFGAAGLEGRVSALLFTLMK